MPTRYSFCGKLRESQATDVNHAVEVVLRALVPGVKNVKPSSVSEDKRGEVCPFGRTLERIATALGMRCMVRFVPIPAAELEREKEVVT